MDAPIGIEGFQDLGMQDDLIEPGNRQGGEPDGGDRPEIAADGAGAAALHGKEAEKQQHGQRQDPLLEARRDDLHALDRREHRNGRGDDTIAVEEGRTRHAGRQHQRRQPAAALDPAQRQRREGENAALAAVVGPHDDDDIFQRHDDDQGPDDQGENAHDPGMGHIAGLGHADLHGVERRGADIAEDDAQRPQHQVLGARVGAGGCVLRRDHPSLRGGRASRAVSLLVMERSRGLSPPGWAKIGSSKRSSAG